jgi:hypothetical protein
VPDSNLSQRDKPSAGHVLILGDVGWGPHIPTIALTPKERAWNHNHESQYRAEDGERTADSTRKRARIWGSTELPPFAAIDQSQNDVGMVLA